MQYCMITFLMRKTRFLEEQLAHHLSHHPVRHVNPSLRKHWQCCLPPAVSHLHGISISSYDDKEPPDSLWFVTDLNLSQLKGLASVKRKPNPKPSPGKMSRSVGAEPPKEKGVSDFHCMSASLTSTQTEVWEWEECCRYKKKKKVAAGYKQWLLNRFIWVIRTVGWLWFDSHIVKVMFLTTIWEMTRPSMPCKNWLSFQFAFSPA